VRVAAARAALLVVDIQERLAAAMPEERLSGVVKATRVLLETARRFSIPVVVTQQYPKGLGRTLNAIEEMLEPLGDLLHRFDKIDFSACAAPEFEDVWKRVGRDQWILTGMESHVCVLQTGRQLMDRGAQVFSAADAVASRTESNRRIGIDLLARHGAVTTSSETVVFEVLGRAGTDDFKALSKMIR